MISEATHVEQRALLNAVEEAHIGKVYMMEEGLAVAFGAGLLDVMAIPGAIVLGADTEVVLDDQVYGKPSDAADALRMLRQLSGHPLTDKGLAAFLADWAKTGQTIG